MITIKNNPYLNNAETRNKVIKALTIIILIGTITSFVCTFIHYVPIYEQVDVNNTNDSGEWESLTYPTTVGYVLQFYFPDISLLIISILYFCPFILFVIYIFKFYNKDKYKFLIPIVMAGFVLSQTLTLISEFKYLPDYFNFKYDYIYNFSSVFNYIFNLHVGLLIPVSLLVSYIIATIGAVKGFSSKKYYLPVVILLLCRTILNVINYFQALDWLIRDKIYLWIISDPVIYLGVIAFGLVLLLFCPTHTTPVYKVKIESLDKLNPVTALRILNEQFKNGQISEEEYTTKRTQILNKLSHL